MFDIAPSELLLVAVVALLVIGPKDLPLALRTAGQWLGKLRRMSNHFRAGVETMIREAELAEIEKEWRERNARIMAEHPDAAALDAGVSHTSGPAGAPAYDSAALAAGAEAAAQGRAGPDTERPETAEEPELPLHPRQGRQD